MYLKMKKNLQCPYIISVKNKRASMKHVQRLPRKTFRQHCEGSPTLDSCDAGVQSNSDLRALFYIDRFSPMEERQVGLRESICHLNVFGPLNNRISYIFWCRIFLNIFWFDLFSPQHMVETN